MATTTNGYPYPAGSDTADVPRDIYALAYAVDTKAASLAAGNTFTAGPNTFVPASSSALGLIVKGAASQSGNLQQWQNSASSPLVSVLSNGGIQFAAGIAPTISVDTASTTDRLVVSGGVSAATGGAIVLRGQTASTNAFGVEVYAGGSERMRIDSAGNVGIGTSSPAGLLHVESDSSNLVRFGKNSTDTVSAAIQFVKRRGTAASPTIVSAGDTLGTLYFYGYDGSGLKTAAAIASSVDAAPGANDMPGNILFYTTPDGSTSLAERMRIDNAGNVGIGATSPSSLLTLYKNSASAVQTNHGNSVATWLSGIDASGNYSIYSNNAYNVLVSTNGTERMRIDSSGNVGIGTSSPSAALHVVGGAPVAWFQRYGGNPATYLIRANGTSSVPTTVASGDLVAEWSGWGYDGSTNKQAGAVQVVADATVSAGIVPGRLVFSTTNTSGTATERMRIDSAGNVGVGTTDPTGWFALAPRFVVVKNQDAETILGVSNNVSGVNAATAIRLIGGTANSFTIIRLNDSNGTPTFDIGHGGGVSRMTFGFSGIERMRIDASGGLVGINGPASGTQLQVTNNIAANVGLIVKGAATQSGDLQQWQNSAGTTLSSVNSLGYLGVGTAASSTRVLGIRSDGSDTLLFLEKNSDSNSPSMNIYRARASTGVTSGDIMGDIVFQGRAVNSFPLTARIRVQSEGTIADSQLPSNMAFWTAQNGTGTMTERMRIDSSGNVGIGTASPISRFHSVQDGATQYSVFDTFVTSISSTQMLLRKARGSVASPSAVVAGDTLGQYGVRGQGATAMGANTVASITMGATENFTDTSQPTAIWFNTTPTGSVSPTERMRIDSNGNVGIGTSPLAKFHVYDASNAIALIRGDSNTYLGVRRASADSTAPVIYLDKTRGTQATPAVITTGDSLAQLDFRAYDGSAMVTATQILAGSEGTLSTGVIPSNLVFKTSSTAGTLTERMRIDSSGLVGVNGAASGAQLQVTNGTAGNVGLIVKGAATQSGDLVQVQNSSGTSLVKIDSAGHITLEGVTSTGATGTGKFVFSSSPVLTALDLAAGTATAGTAPLTFTAGTNLTVAEAGTVEYDGTNFYGTQSKAIRAPITTPFVFKNQGAVTIANTATTGLSLLASSTNASASTGIALAAATTYEFEMRFTFSSTGTTSHTEAIGFYFSGTTSFYNYEITRTVANVASSATTYAQVASGTTLTSNITSTVSTPAIAATVTNAMYVVRGWVTTNTAGNWTPVIVLSATPGATSTVAAGATFKITPYQSASGTVNLSTWA